MYIGARGQFHLPERRPYGQLRRCPVRGTTDLGPALAWRFATRSLAMETCIAHVFLVRRRPPKWAQPARARHWMQCISSLLLFNLCNSGRALRMLDACWLKPELYDLKLPMDTLHALPMLCVSNIVIE